MIDCDDEQTFRMTGVDQTEHLDKTFNADKINEDEQIRIISLEDSEDPGKDDKDKKDVNIDIDINKPNYYYYWVWIVCFLIIIIFIALIAIFWYKGADKTQPDGMKQGYGMGWIIAICVLIIFFVAILAYYWWPN